MNDEAGKLMLDAAAVQIEADAEQRWAGLSTMPTADWGELTTIAVPESSAWTVWVAGINYTPLKGQEPNWLGRQMSRWLLGAKWTKTRP